MKENLILTIDIGTKSCRVCLFNKKGEIVSIIKKEYEKPYISEYEGEAEQDPDFYFNTIIESIKELKSNSGDYFDSITGITMDTIRDSAVLLDENYKPLHSCILWLDQRLAKADEKRPFIHRLIYKIIGMSKTVQLNREKSMSLWYQENKPDLWKQAKYYGNISSYLTYKLTGEFADSPASIIGHFPLNYKHRKYYKSINALANLFNVPTSMMPKLVPCGKPLGKITSKIAEMTGLKEGLILYSCGSDKSCESLGLGALTSNVAAISYGTASTIEVTTKKYHNAESFLPSYPACIPNYYNMDVLIYRGFWMVEWFLKNFCHYNVSNYNEFREASHQFDKKMLEVAPGCNGLILQPYWQPGLSKPLGRGAVIGFTDTHTDAHFYRAIIEGIAFALREGLVIFEKKTHKKVDKLMISGVGSQRDEICQITANIFGCPVYRVQTYETSSLGAAICGFLATKEYNTPEQAISAMVHEGDVFNPDKDETFVYNKIFKKGYRKMYPSLKKIYKAVQ